MCVCVFPQALDPELRKVYARVTLQLLKPGGRMLLLVPTDTQGVRRGQGPPYCIELEEVQSLYGAGCSITRLSQASVPRWEARGWHGVEEVLYLIVKHPTK